MAHYLIDTGLVLRHLRGHRRTVRLLSGFGQLNRLAVSAITPLEVHAGMHEAERYATDKLVSRFVTYEVNREVADRAGDLIRACRERNAFLSVPDAVIAATALAHGLTLVTLNTQDFEGLPGLRLATLPPDTE